MKSPEAKSQYALKQGNKQTNEQKQNKYIYILNPNNELNAMLSKWNGKKRH